MLTSSLAWKASELSRERGDFARSIERQSQSREHHDISVKLHLGESANPERGESVAVIQITERTLNRGAATVEVAEALRV